MGSIEVALAALDQAVDALGAADLDVLDPMQRYAVLERLETARRRQIAVGHDLITRLEQVTGLPPVVVGLSDAVRISRREARRRIRDAEQLAPRITLSGTPVPPVLPATASAWAAGLLDGEHLRVIQGFFRDMPSATPAAAISAAEAFLADKATELRPDQLEKVATRLALTINPDGTFTDADRARQRGFAWCGQRVDGMSIGRLVATPELRATLDALLAKFAAPGMCNPADQVAAVNTEPSEAAISGDNRSHAQRQHDGLLALLRSQLGDPKLGQHNGLPVTIIVSTTLEQLHAGAGHAVTAGGTLMPISDVIRLAAHSWHYLCVYDTHDRRPLYLGRSKRIASPDQRIVLHGLHRGCTAPGCDKPGYLTEVHHNHDWAKGGRTDITELTLACKADHDLLTNGGWNTRRQPTGTTEWIPPPGLPYGGGINDYHHPERLLPTAEKPPEDARRSTKSEFRQHRRRS